MGIKGLLKFLDECMSQESIYRFRGQKFGIDMSCFIFKSFFHENYLEHLDLYLRLFTKVAQKIFIVFDGKPPAAKLEEIERRQEHMAKYGPGIPKITPEIVAEIMERYKNNEKIVFVRAPGEADAQLAYMSANGIVDVVVTEDSDLILYGTRVVLFKLKPRGDCQVFCRKMLENFLPWNFEIFQYICILCGCDYLKGGLRGFGFQKARKILDKNSKFESQEEFLKFLEKDFDTSPEFCEAFKKAMDAFMRQKILCLSKKNVREFCNAIGK